MYLNLPILCVSRVGSFLSFSSKMMEELTQFLLWSVFLLALAILFLRGRSTKNSHLPPGPRKLPVLGNLLQLGKNPHRSLALLARTHGPVMFLKLGSINTVVISSPGCAKQVLIRNEHSISGRQIPHVVKAVGHHELSVAFSSRNQFWRYLRTIIKSHLFNTQSLDATQLLRRRKVEELVAYIKWKRGEAVHIAHAAFCTLLNQISNTFFSVDMVDFRSESAQELEDLMRGILEESGRPNISDFFPCLAPFDLQGREHRFATHYKKLNDYFDLMIENRLAATAGEEKTANSDILDVLLQLCQEDDSKLNTKIIKALLTDSFLAGTETSSTSLEWAMAELLRRPALMTRARQEIAAIVGFERQVEESDIAKLPFLQAVLKETFRLHPPVPFLLPYRTEASAEINGYTVPKNTQVIVNVWAIGRDERVWESPDCFMPERFMGGTEIHFLGQHFELIPFGSGRRMCPGLPFGVMMTQLMLASLIQSFEWNLPCGMKPEDLDLNENFGLTLVMASPLKALATPTK